MDDKEKLKISLDEIIKELKEDCKELEDEVKNLVFNEREETYSSGLIPINIESKKHLEGFVSKTMEALNGAITLHKIEKTYTTEVLTLFLVTSRLFNYSDSYFSDSRIENIVNKTVPILKLSASYQSFIELQPLMLKKIKTLSKKATMYSRVEAGAKAGLDKRYGKNRELYPKALDIAKMKWQEGSKLKHDKMRDWLMDYDENGVVIFSKLSESSLLIRLKKMLYEMGRSDLIRGNLDK